MTRYACVAPDGTQTDVIVVPAETAPQLPLAPWPALWNVTVQPAGSAVSPPPVAAVKLNVSSLLPVFCTELTIVIAAAPDGTETVEPFTAARIVPPLVYESAV